MLNLRQTAHTAVRELKNLHKGKVTLSANEHTVFYLLPVIAEFRRRYPLIKVEVQRGVASRIPTEVMAREVELGIISFKPNDESVKSIAVFTDELALVVSPKHPFANKGKVSVKELGNESFIAHNAPSPYRQKVIETFEKYRTPLNISIELPSLEAIKNLVEINAGIALVPKLTAEAEIKSGQLKSLTVNEMKLERRLHIIYRRNSVLSQAAQGFLELIKEMEKSIGK